MQKAWIRRTLMMGIGVFCFNAAIWSQQSALPNLEWEEGRRLSWNDYPFKKLRSSKREIALTSVKHSVTGRMKNGTPDFEVRVLYIAKDSWTTDTTNLKLLAHEQLHFDIGELFRRKIEGKVNRLRDSGEKQKAIYRYAIKKLLSDFRFFSNDYDKATRHGQLSAEQAKWKTKVWEELQRLQ